MKVVYPVCCGVDVHKSFFIATIITTTSDIQPNYSRKRFSTFNNDILRFANWLSENNCNDVTVDDVNYLIESTDHSIKNGVHYVKLGLRKFG